MSIRASFRVGVRVRTRAISESKLILPSETRRLSPSQIHCPSHLRASQSRPGRYVPRPCSCLLPDSAPRDSEPRRTELHCTIFELHCTIFDDMKRFSADTCNVRAAARLQKLSYLGPCFSFTSESGVPGRQRQQLAIAARARHGAWTRALQRPAGRPVQLTRTPVQRARTPARRSQLAQCGARARPHAHPGGGSRGHRRRVTVTGRITQVWASSQSGSLRLGVQVLNLEPLPVEPRPPARRTVTAELPGLYHLTII